MKFFIVSEHKPGNESEHRRWKIALPSFGDKGFYQSTTSYNWFFNGVNKRNHKPDGTFYYPINVLELRFYNHITNPPTEAISLYDWYEAVGYDRKKKKWR